MLVHVQARSQQLLWGVLFEENVDLILQPIKVQEQLKAYAVYTLPTFMRAFNKKLHIAKNKI